MNGTATFPAFAEKASRAIGKFYDTSMGYDGTLQTALRLMDEAGAEISFKLFGGK